MLGWSLLVFEAISVKVILNSLALFFLSFSPSASWDKWVCYVSASVRCAVPYFTHQIPWSNRSSQAQSETLKHKLKIAFGPHKPIASSICYNGRKIPGAETWPSLLPWPFLNTEYKCKETGCEAELCVQQLKSLTQCVLGCGHRGCLPSFSEQASFFENTMSKYPLEIQFSVFAFFSGKGKFPNSQNSK